MSGTYGMTPNGYVRRRRPEMRKLVLDKFEARTGIKLDDNPDTITGRLIDTFVDLAVSQDETAEAVYNSKYPNSAEGIQLDYAVAFAGVRRIPSRRTQVIVTIMGTGNYEVSPGFTVRGGSTNYTLVQPVNLLQASCTYARFEVPSGVAGEIYEILLNGISYSFTAQSNVTAEEAASNLRSALATAPVVATRTGRVLELHSPDRLTAMNIGKTANLTANFRVGNVGNFVASEAGAIAAPVGTVTEKVTQSATVHSVYNHFPGVAGRVEESDEELRARYPTGVFRLGAATVPAMEPNIMQNVPNVTFAKFYHNPLSTTDTDGRPPHSVEFVVQGGADADIAREIFRIAAGGIEQFGTVAVPIKDSAGTVQIIRFNRPTVYFTWVNVTVTLYTEEVFPGDGIQQIRDAVAAAGNKFGVGGDVLLQRLQSASHIPGVKSVAVSVGLTLDPNAQPATNQWFSSSAVALNARQLATFDPARVSVAVL